MGSLLSKKGKNASPLLLPRRRRKFMKYYRLGPKVGIGVSLNMCLERLEEIIKRASNADRVVKIIAKPYKYEDFALEVLILKGVGNRECPNVVEFFDYFEDKRFYYSVMEYCRGGDLFSFVASRTTPFKESEIASWISQILTAIAYIHSKGVVHRDIKPANLLFLDDSCQELKVIDFGLSLQMKKGELLDEPCGTPEFLAPEMILGRYGRKVDIWSVGVLSYILLYGCRPFVSNNDVELFRRIVESEPQFIPIGGTTDYSPSQKAKNFCELLLTKNSRQRPTAQEALQNPWLIHPPQAPLDIIPRHIQLAARQETLEMDQRQQQLSPPPPSRKNTLENATGILQAVLKRAPTRMFSRPLSKPIKAQESFTRVNVNQYVDLTNEIETFRTRGIPSEPIIKSPRLRAKESSPPGTFTSLIKNQPNMTEVPLPHETKQENLKHMQKSSTSFRTFKPKRSQTFPSQGSFRSITTSQHNDDDEMLRTNDECQKVEERRRSEQLLDIFESPSLIEEEIEGSAFSSHMEHKVKSGDSDMFDGGRVLFGTHSFENCDSGITKVSSSMS